MPIVRIDLTEGKSEEYRAQVGEIVYQTLVNVLNVPKDDRFHVIPEHHKSALPFDRDHLGVHRTDDCIFFQITLNAGRSVELKQSFYNKEVTDRLPWSRIRGAGINLLLLNHLTSASTVSFLLNHAILG